MSKWEEIKCKTERTEEKFMEEVEKNKNNSKLAKKYYNEVKKQKGENGMSKRNFLYEVNRTVRQINDITGLVEYVNIKGNADITIEREFFTGNYRAFISFPNYVGEFSGRDNLSGFANFLGLTVQRQRESDKVNVIFVMNVNGGKYASLNDTFIIPKTKEEKKYLQSKKVIGLAEMEELAKIMTNRILEFVNVTSDYVNTKMNIK